jgi:hypothetical protein
VIHHDSPKTTACSFCKIIVGHRDSDTFTVIVLSNTTNISFSLVIKYYFILCRFLSGNELTGPVPEELGFLPNLRIMQIDDNKLSGPIPLSFANLNKTKHL